MVEREGLAVIIDGPITETHADLKRRVAAPEKLSLVDPELLHQHRHTRDRRFADAHRRYLGGFDQCDLDCRPLTESVDESIDNHGCQPAGGTATNNRYLFNSLAHFPLRQDCVPKPIIRIGAVRQIFSTLSVSGAPLSST